MEIGIAVSFLCWAVASLATLLGTWQALRHFIGFEPQEFETFPPVSILKPLKGLEPGMERNLESFFLLSYPTYELVFSVGSVDDPVVPLIQKLIAKYPAVSSTLITEDRNFGPNPKVNNLLLSYQKAKFDILLISDSNVRAPKNYLSVLVPDLRSDVGIVTSVVSGESPEGIGGYLEAAYLNTFFARWMFLAKFFGFPSVVGKSMLFKKSVMDRIGGIKTLAWYIAEDYMAGHAMKQLGLSVELGRRPVIQYIGSYTFKSFWQRHLRWGRIRKSIAPFAFLIEPFFGAFVSGLVGAFAFASQFHLPFLFCFAVHLLLWWGLDCILITTVSGPSVRGYLTWWLRELLAFPIWVGILSGNSVQWRGNRLKVEPGGLLEWRTDHA